MERGGESLQLASRARLRVDAACGAEATKILRLWVEPPEEAPAQPSAAPWWLVTSQPPASCPPSPTGWSLGLGRGACHCSQHIPEAPISTHLPQ